MGNDSAPHVSPNTHLILRITVPKHILRPRTGLLNTPQEVPHEARQLKSGGPHHRMAVGHSIHFRHQPDARLPRHARGDDLLGRAVPLRRRRPRHRPRRL